MEDNLHSINSMRNMDIIDIKTGKKLGFISDIKLDCEGDKVLALIVPGASKGWFGKSEEIEIPWENVEKIGMDVILVSGENLNISNEENNIYR
ncbi:MAG: YlmC/YmxH family sporulation protein [Clostridium sp.]|uniref:YlmC/YmxH family sporulation protein n=1 Tax=Clostridium sp. TaxID=1506 RepID=UPI002FC60492